MARINICFVWHMHQPFYKDLMSGEYKLPWTRMHGLKDYYGMVEILRDFPAVRQTFNLVPSMMVQLEEYASGNAEDQFLRAALKPAEDLSGAEKEFILRYFFQANVARMIYRYPRYRELHDASARAGRFFATQDFRDLQVLSQLAWFDEEFLEKDPEVAELVRKGRGYTTADQECIARKEREILGKVIPVCYEFAASGQIELSTTPYYHPILPLLCDSDIARVSHPGVPLPGRFQFPEDAAFQLVRALQYMEEKFGNRPAGLWPSEGSVSDAALALAADLGFRWFASDNGVLTRTLGRPAGVEETYRPYIWRRGGSEMHCIFRDHYLSDLIGFVYSRMSADEAAGHFLDRIRENCSGRTALVPVILDGENAWEYYHLSGRSFLRKLYQRIQDDPEIEAVTVSEGLRRMEPAELAHIFPGSWINANFDVWIGAEEDNKAWEYLRLAREAYERRKSSVSEEARKLAYEELLIAEGSDWCWWYGPEHDSANRPEFDQLFRDHLTNVYRMLGAQPPDELSRSILRTSESAEVRQLPTSLVRPLIDGEVGSYFEWMGAGYARVDHRSGAMHGQRSLLKELYYGSDGEQLYLRMDFAGEPDVESLEVRVRSPRKELVLGRSDFSYQQILEAAIPLQSLGMAGLETAEFQVSLWLDGLATDSVPQSGWLFCPTGPE
jgi:alpha-amylase/alpha-mannosidase (GH57 family)